VTTSQGFGRDVPERGGMYDGASAAEPSAADLAPRLGTLTVIRAALRRRAWLWRVVAVLGLLAGVGVSVARPVPYQAATTVLLTPEPGAQVGEEMPNDVIMLQSNTVAERAMRDLKLGPADNLVGTYTVKPLTDRVLVLEVKAPSSAEAVRRANALAAEFLKYRAQQLQAQQKLVFASLSQQLSQAQQRVATIAGKISSVSAQPATSAQQSELKSLEDQRNQAESALNGLQQSTTSYRVTQQQAMVSMIDGSQVLDTASPLKHTTEAKHALLYGGLGLGAGLVLGLGLAVVLELVSDRLRRREDVARALGVPVRLSVATVPARRRGPGLPWRSAARDGDLQRIAGYLRDSVPEVPGGGAAALAVVAVDNAPAAAAPLVSLAVSLARQGRQVVLADLSGGHAARLLGAADPGVRTVTADGAQLVVAVPGRGEAAPAGPVHRGLAPAGPGGDGPAGKELAEAYAAADYLFTLVTLDPSLGAEYLPGWATDAVVTVTAGESSWEKLHSAGEMVRLSGTRLVSAVLIGADHTDESLGATPAPQPLNNVIYWQGRS
jgi:capsular polysaccharide biosynthesis protein